MEPLIRRIRFDEWREVRSLRLLALAEAPTAFGSTLAAEQAFSEDVWRERTLGASSGCDRATFIAEFEGVWIGAVTGLANQFAGANGLPLLVAMFVVASERGRGVGKKLVDNVSSWVRDCGANQLALLVTSDNASAIALYERCGFRFTGKTRPHLHADGLFEREMVRQFWNDTPWLWPVAVA